MNQILITGEEKVKQQKEKKVISIKAIVRFYAISIIILGLCIISGSTYARVKINETVEANAKPSVEINRNDEDNTVEVYVKHIRGISAISYRWNNEEETIINGNNRKELSETIYLIGGKNTLTVTITDENGKSVSYEKTYTVGNIPTIELEPVSNGIKVICKGEQELDYLTYNWDNGDEQKIEIGATEYEGIINAPKGKHVLNIEVVDKNKMKATKTENVIGDAAPTLELQHDNIAQKAIIDAKDDEKITTVEIKINDQETQTINVEDKAYHTEIDLEPGVNKIIITVTNLNGLSYTRRVIIENTSE